MLRVGDGAAEGERVVVGVDAPVGDRHRAGCGPGRVSCGKPEFEPQFGAPLVLGSTVNCWVMTTLSPPELTPLKLKLSGPAAAGAV